MSSGFLFRLATQDDLPAIFELVNLVYRGDTGLRSWTGEAHLLGGQRTDLAQLRDVFEKPQSFIILATSQKNSEELIGCVSVRGNDDGGAFLSMLTVHVDRQKVGLGRALLAAAESFVVEKFGSKTMSMYVITVRTELIDWYKRRGYHVTGEKKDWFWGQPQYGIPLRDDLELEILKKSLVTQ